MTVTMTTRPPGHDPHCSEHALARRQFLCRFDDHRPFAYARGHDYIRCADHALWAHLTNGKLLSARSGCPLAYQRDNIFYDANTHQPIYYQSAGS